MGVSQLSATDLDGWLKDIARKPPILLDVREAWELDRCCLAGSLHMPMNQVPARVGELGADREIVVICHHGGRSAAVANWLAQRGFPGVHNLSGGVDAWARLVDPSMPRY